MPLYGMRLVCSRHISRRNLSSLPETFKAFKFISRVISYIDDVTGATEIREAHATLKQNEKKLQDAQALRRKKRDELDALQIRMKEIHSELDRFSRGDDKYLRLLTEEHAIIKSEQLLIADVRKADEAEKAAFDELSSTLRTSRANEQEQSDRVKTWTVIGSTCGALFGIIGAWVANEVRMRKMKELIPDSALLTPLIKKMTALFEKQQNEVAAFITDIREAMHLKAPEGIAITTQNKGVTDNVLSDTIVNLLQEQNKVLRKELDAVKRLIAIELNLKAETPNVVYIGNDMEELLSKSEKNIESKMKLQTLVEVVFLYTLVVVSLPLIYAFIKGP
ncbi:Exocyst complex component Sec3 family protein [Acanthocheilonema viteae]